MRGDDAGHHHRMQVGVGDDLGQCLLLAQAVLHPARTRRVRAHLVEDAPGQLPEVADRMRNRDLFFRPGASPSVDGMGNGILAQQVHVLFGHAQEMQRHGQRHFPQHLVDQVGAAVVDKAVDVFARQAPHHRLVMRQLGGRERVHQRAPARHVGGLVLVDQRAVHGIAVRGQHRVGCVAGGRDLLQRDRRAEGEVVAEDRLDVVVARDHPVAELGAVEHRFLLARPAHVLGRILLVAVAERIELRRLVADRAAIGGGEGGMVDGTAAARGVGGGGGHAAYSWLKHCRPVCAGRLGDQTIAGISCPA
ncbi:hypothetical protein FQZ97_690350 [compost metagenome]